jgi:cell division protein FtsB
VQHQQKQIAELKAQNEEQRAHNAALETRLQRLETQAARTTILATRYERF